MARVGCMGVVLGAFVTVVLAWLLVMLVLTLISAVAPTLGEASGGAGPESSREILLVSAAFLVLLLSFFSGGVVAGLAVVRTPGLNGLTSAAAVAAIGLVLALIGFLTVILNPISNPGEVYTRAENLSMVLVVIIAFCAFCPFGVVAGYLGGLLGGRMRRAA